MAGHMKDWVQIKMRQAGNRIKLALNKFGAKEFLAETYNVFNSQTKSLADKVTPMYEAVRTKVETKEGSEGRELYAKERATLIFEDMKKIKEEENKYPYAEKKKGLIEEITGITVSLEEEKKKKAEEEKKQTEPLAAAA